MYFVGFGFAGEMFVRTCEEGFDQIGMGWWRFCLNRIKLVRKVLMELVVGTEGKFCWRWLKVGTEGE